MSLPDPLIPTECTMAGNDWFPFYFDRVRKSKWWRRASDVARSRNVMMWGEAYKGTPAGSLPDDDDELAEAAGYGMDVDAFLAHKSEIMAPWTLCSDGRWYHPTVCEVVLDAWAKAGDRRRKDCERKARQRAQVRPVTGKNANVHTDNDDVTRDNADVPPENGTHTEQTEQDILDADASLSSEADERPEYPDEFEVCWKAYPHVKGRSSKSKSLGYWRRITSARRALLPLAVERYASEGREPREDCGAPAMERWLRDQRYLDWLEADVAPAPALTSWAGPADVFDAVRLERRDDTWAIFHLSRCRWDAEARTLTADKVSHMLLKRDAEYALRRIGVRLICEGEVAA